MADIFWWSIGIVTGSGLVTSAVLYLLFKPEKAEILAGWIARFVAFVWRRADRAAVAMGVQGEINSSRERLIENAPGDLVEHKIKIRWADENNPRAILQGNEVVVFMRDSGNKPTNVARALMAYLPKAVLPRVRRYVDPETMQASDLVLAKSMLADRKMLRGAVEVFFDEHMDPLRAGSPSLCAKLNRLDQIDLHGWLTRILLEEFRILGNDLYPGEPDPRFAADAEQFLDWLHEIAAAGSDERASLDYRGPYFRVSVMFVAMAGKLQLHGIEPYRRRAKRLIYKDRVDALYLLARDRSIEAVRQLATSLASDALIASTTEYSYPLRPDFGVRVVRRERAIATCLRRRRADVEGGLPSVPVEDDDDDLAHESVTFVDPDAQEVEAEQENSSDSSGSGQSTGIG